jgi:transposase
MGNEFWFSDEQWSKIDAHSPKNRSGAHRVDDRRVISGIIHVLKKWLPMAGPPEDLPAFDHGL